jgi:hypothetical protein
MNCDGKIKITGVNIGGSGRINYQSLFPMPGMKAWMNNHYFKREL